MDVENFDAFSAIEAFAANLLVARCERNGISQPCGWKKKETTRPKAPVRSKTTGKKNLALL